MFAQVAYTTLAVVLVIGAIAVHEYGHLRAMRRWQVQVAEFSLGFGPALYQRTARSGLRFSVRAIPLGGYVCATEPDAIGKLPSRGSAEIAGAGVVANLVCGLPVLAVSIFALGLHGWLYPTVMCCTAAALYRYRRIAERYSLVLGLVFVALLAWTLLDPPAGPHTSILAGPVELFKTLICSTLWSATGIASAVCVIMAVLNALPLLPLDGGHIAARWLFDRLSERAYTRCVNAMRTVVLASFAVPLLHDLAVDVLHLPFL